MGQIKRTLEKETAERAKLLKEYNSVKELLANC